MKTCLSLDIHRNDVGVGNTWPPHALIVFESLDPLFRVILRENIMSGPRNHIVPSWEIDLDGPLPDPIPNVRDQLLLSWAGEYCKEILWAVESWLATTRDSDDFLPDLFHNCFLSGLLPVKTSGTWCMGAKDDIIRAFGTLIARRSSCRNLANSGPSRSELEAIDI